MAGAAFPAWVHVIGDGYAAGQDIDVARTTFDDGFVRQVKRFTAAQETRALEIVIGPDAGYLRFRAWARERAHAWFAWTDPEDGVTRECRVRGRRWGHRVPRAGVGRERTVLGGHAHARGPVGEDGGGRRVTGQTIALGAPAELYTSEVEWTGLAARLESGLVAGGATAYLRHFELRTGFGYVLMRLSLTAAGDAGAAGPELTETMETSGTLTLTAGALTLTLPGPGAPGNAVVDAVEPYFYDVPDADQALMRTWLDAYNALGAAARAGAALTLWDGEGDPPGATAPDLEPTFGAAAIADQAYVRGVGIAPSRCPRRRAAMRPSSTLSLPCPRGSRSTPPQGRSPAPPRRWGPRPSPTPSPTTTATRPRSGSTSWSRRPRPRSRSPTSTPRGSRRWCWR